MLVTFTLVSSTLDCEGALSVRETTTFLKGRFLGRLASSSSLMNRYLILSLWLMSSLVRLSSTNSFCKSGK